MKQTYNEKTISKMLMRYSKSPYNVESWYEVLKRIEVMPEWSQKVFKIRWGLDEAQQNCDSISVKKLASIISIPDAHEIYKEAEQDFAKAKYVLYLEDYNDLKFDMAIRIGKLAKTYYNTFKFKLNHTLIGTVDSKKILECVQNLNDKYKTILIYHYGLDGNEPMPFRKISEILHLTPAYIQHIECEAFYVLRNVHNYFSKVYIECSELDELLFKNRLSRRAYYILRRNGISTLNALKECTESEILSMKGVGSIVFNEILELQKNL